MQISKRKFNKPEGKDLAEISKISENFEHLDNMLDSIVGREFGGFIENDSDGVEEGKVYVDKRSFEQWLVKETGGFSDVLKLKLDFNNCVNVVRKVETGIGLSGGGDLREDRELSLNPATRSSLGGVKIGEGLIVGSDGTISALPPVGGLLFLTQNANPNTIYLGTSWEKIEGCYLKGTSAQEQASGITGGSNSKTLTIGNMPSHNHTASSPTHTHSVNQSNHSHGATQSKHRHTQGNHRHRTWGEKGPSPFGSTGSANNYGSKGGSDKDNYHFYTSSDSAGTISEAQPPITVHGAKANINLGSTAVTINMGSTGSGQAFNVEPSYYTVNIWKRLA